MSGLIKKLNLDASYAIALQNRLIIATLPVFLVATRLKLSRKEKFNFFKNYLSYEEFDAALDSFRTKKFGFIYRFLYYLLTKKRYKFLYYMLRMSDFIYARKS